MAVLHFPKTIAVIAAMSALIAGCDRGGRDTPPARASAVVVRDTAHAHANTVESDGDVRLDSAGAPVAGVWFTDANALSLLGLMSSREIAAANLELERYRSDTVRAFAEETIREHRAIQHSADSVAAVTRLAPVPAALAAPVGAKMQAQIDSVQWVRGRALDRSFVRQQIVGHELMETYVQQLAAAAQRPEVQALMSSVGGRVRSHLERARGLQVFLAAADSVAIADSAAKASARAKRRPTDR
jgi:predicted outer membrane protein